MFPQEASERLRAGGCVSRLLRSTPFDPRFVLLGAPAPGLPVQKFVIPSSCSVVHGKGKRPRPALALCEGKLTINPQQPTLNSVRAGFTLLELLIVVGIIAVLLVLIAPVFTSLKSAGDVTNAAYTIKGVLDTARTYAKANSTYTWVGFFEEDVTQASTTPPTPGIGRLVMSIVASKDGSNIYGSGTGTIDPTKLVQIGKLLKIDNIHVPLFAVCASSCTGDTFDTRPPLQNDPTAGYNYSRFGELNAAPPNTAPYTTPYNFQYPVGNPAPAAQYTFSKLLQFNPRGESRVNGNSYDIRRVVEIGVVQTHGNGTPVPVSGGGTSNVVFSGNVVAVQVTGFGGSVKIYRR